MRLVIFGNLVVNGIVALWLTVAKGYDSSVQALAPLREGGL